ncbi:MAG TPA: hypothetical protein DCF62_10905 [Porticoccaceae bacterium]|nr:hypothetical protein [Porticoccaceae bacterium]HCO61646.1 hypothetical protein [Porticoccaceae bacterium]
MRRTGLLLITAVALLSLLIAALWYRAHYGMKQVASYEFNDPELPQRVLIATQGSAFKDAVLAELLTYLSDLPVHVQVRDVSALATVNEADWTALVIIHTWEYWRPEPTAAAFLTRAANREHVIVLSTSGDGNKKIDNIDALTAASDMSAVPRLGGALKQQLSAILKSENLNAENPNFHP